MRQQFCDALVARAVKPEMIFLTGDLGFMALEPLQKAMGERFINAGVAEQNMISVAAALARQGLEVWAYSIAPFCYARPFEQMRNDITFHNLPVKLVGNGGGYGYGVMGPTHHAIEDYGVLLCLPGMSVYVPVFDEDLDAVVVRVGRIQQSGLSSARARGTAQGLSRAGLRALAPVDPGKRSGGDCRWAARRRIYRGLRGSCRVDVVPISGLSLSCRSNSNPLPEELLAQIIRGPGLFVAEEHVRRGGFGSELALHLAESGVAVSRFRSPVRPRSSLRSLRLPALSAAQVRNRCELDARCAGSDRSPTMSDLQAHIRALHGPILVTGASGFIGANLFKTLAVVRDDVYAVVRRGKNWRLADGPQMKTSSQSTSTTLRPLRTWSIALDRRRYSIAWLTAPTRSRTKPG